MTIPRNRPTGGYAGTTTIASAEFEHFDKYLAEAIHGKGGTYTLVEQLVIGGDNVVIDEGLAVHGAIVVDQDLVVGGDGEFVGHLVVSQTLNVAGLVAFGDELDVAGAIDIGGNAQIDGTLHVDGVVAFEDDLAVYGALEVIDGAAISGTTALSTVTVGTMLDAQGAVFLGGVSDDVDVRGTAIFRKRIAFLDGGKIEYRQKVISTDADQTVLATQVDTVYLANGIITAARNIEILDTGATDGMRVAFRSAETTHTFVIKAPGGALTLGSLSGVTRPWGYVERISGSWVFFTGGV